MSFFRSIPVLMLSLLVALCFAACSDNSVTPIIPGDNHTLTLTDPVNESSAAGAGFNVPAGVNVTSNSVSNGSISLGVSDLSGAAQAGFSGTVYGGASFTPADATFSSPVEVSIPVDGVIGTATVYYSGSAVSQAGYAVFLTNLDVTDGFVHFTITRFGTYLIGEETVDIGHNEGGGSSF